MARLLAVRSGCHRRVLHASQCRIEVDAKRDTMKHSIGTTLCLAMMASSIALPGLAADPAATAQVANLTVTMRRATQEGTSEALGTVTISSTVAGASFKLALHGLPPGPHGFQVHENANCSPIFMSGVRIPAGAAGSPFDPDETGRHEGPLGEGYLGDLPVLQVAPDGTATQTLTAPRIKNIDVLRRRSLIIHIGGDNYKDEPNLDGGSGGRLACGLVE
jgi:Cu-Zn family superoxide dismutase